MRVRIGGRTRRVVSDADVRAVSDVVEGRLREVVVERALEVTPAFLRRTAARAQAAAEREANRIFEVLTQLLDRGPVPGGTGSTVGIRASELTRGTELFARGQVMWSLLSTRYALHKNKKYPQNADRFYRYTGGLRDYFKGTGPRIVKSRLGGIQIDIDDKVTPATSGVDPTNPEIERRNLLLGRVTVTMFPLLTPSLAPMLATRDWTSTNDGQLERSIFGGTKAAWKLTGRSHAYRPLFTPVLQFFMLVRMPEAIRRSMQFQIDRTARAGRGD